MCETQLRFVPNRAFRNTAQPLHALLLIHVTMLHEFMIVYSHNDYTYLCLPSVLPHL